MGRKELHLNDPAHTATSGSPTPNEKTAEQAPLPQRGAPTKLATGAAGGLDGTAAGSAARIVVGGPIGAAVGAIAGAVGGWWMGHGSVAATDWSDEDDAHYRRHHESVGGPADRRYDHARPAYHLGYVASRNPDYAGRAFDEIEGDLRHGWTEELQGRHGTWDAVRDRVRFGYEQPRGLAHVERTALGGDPAADAAHRAHDRVADERGR